MKVRIETDTGKFLIFLLPSLKFKVRNVNKTLSVDLDTILGKLLNLKEIWISKMNSYYMSCDHTTFSLVLLICISMRSKVILLYFKNIRSDSEPPVSEWSGFGCLGSHKDLQGDFEDCLQLSLHTLVLGGLASPLLEHRPCVIFQILPVASSLISLGWCPTHASLPHYFRLG